MILAAGFKDLEVELNRLDGLVGDGDHGSAMKRGFNAALTELDRCQGVTLPGEILAIVSSSFSDGAGGASGPLFSAFFKELGKACGGGRELGVSELEQGLLGCIERIMRLGKVAVGEKTMLDAFHPAYLAVLDRDQNELWTVARSAAEAARAGALATTELSAKRGRARYVVDGGKGHIDPGAKSVAHILEFFETVVEPKS